MEVKKVALRSRFCNNYVWIYIAGTFFTRVYLSVDYQKAKASWSLIYWLIQLTLTLSYNFLLNVLETRKPKRTKKERV